MLKSKSFLCLDFGAGSLKAAEFELTEAGALCLKKFGIRPLGLEGSQDGPRAGALQRNLTELLKERGFSAKNILASTPGYQVFSKYVKLPPVDTSKVTQIIQYEAQQNVPFPLEEVVWDYQITGNTPSGELEVFLVAVKSDIVEGLFKIADACNLRLQMVDVAPAALCNAFRYNYSDLEGCTMVLDIGAKTSNVLFFEKGKMSSRTINIGANSITQDFANEARMPFFKAEQFKINEGFVSLGGAYEEPENPQQAQISKVARQVMTRLHIQVNQSIQFYRSQQGGAAPQRLLLAGGASIMPYTAQFFTEKLNIPVEYFNPLRNIQIDPSVNLEELAKVAHSYGELVGLGLRNMAQCPIELNLLPKTIQQQQELNQKQPYFVAAAVCLVLGMIAIGWFYDVKVVSAKREAVSQLQSQIAPLQTLWDGTLSPVLQTNETMVKESSLVGQWVEDRLYWIELLQELHRVLLSTESEMEQRLRAKGGRAGVWIQKLLPTLPFKEEATEQAIVGTEEETQKPRDRYAGMSPELLKRYGLVAPAAAAAAPDPASGEAAKPAETNIVNTITLNCSAINMQKYSATANDELMGFLAEQLRLNTNLFDKGTDLGKNFNRPSATDIIYNFEINLKLKRPIKL